MVRYVDPDAGFATFTQGRSLCVRLQGTVDARTARAVERRLLYHRDAVRLRFECSSVRDIDPAAARILSTAARGWRRQGEGRGVEVHNRPRPSAPLGRNLRRPDLRRTRFQNSEIPGLPRAFRREHLPSRSH